MSGIHNWPSIPLGEVRVCKGPIMAHIIDFDIKVDGRGGHGSQPHVSTSPAHSFIRSLVHSFIRSSVHSFIRSSVHS